MALSAKRPSRSAENKKNVLDAVIEAKPEKKCRLNAEIEEGLYRKIKIACAHENRTVSQITRELWIEYLSNNSNT